MIKLEKFQKHIVLYCKGHYKIPDGDKGFFEGLKMIWAIRCGYDYELTSRDTLSYITDDMFKIIMQCEPQRLQHLICNLHREINWGIGKPANLTPIEAIIWEYRSILANLQIRKSIPNTDDYETIIDIEPLQVNLFNKILSGKGEYTDYEKVN